MNPRPLGPEPSALPNCATPRYLLFCRSPADPRPLGPSSLLSLVSRAALCAALSFMLGNSSSLKSRFSAIFGSPDRVRYQTALHLDSLYIITEAILFVNRKFYFYGGFLQNLRAHHRFKAFHSRSARRAARTHKTTSLGRYNILLTKTASQTDA